MAGEIAKQLAGDLSSVELSEEEQAYVYGGAPAAPAEELPPLPTTDSAPGMGASEEGVRTPHAATGEVGYYRPTGTIADAVLAATFGGITRQNLQAAADTARMVSDAYQIAKNAWRDGEKDPAKVGTDAFTVAEVGASTLFGALGRLASVPDYAIGGAAWAGVKMQKSINAALEEKNGAKAAVLELLKAPAAAASGLVSGLSSLLWRSPHAMHTIAEALGEAGVPDDVWATSWAAPVLAKAVWGGSVLNYHYYKMHDQEMADAYWEAQGKLVGPDATGEMRRRIEATGPLPRETVGMMLEILFTGVNFNRFAAIPKAMASVARPFSAGAGAMFDAAAKALPAYDATDVWYSALKMSKKGLATRALAAIGPEALQVADEGSLVRNLAQKAGVNTTEDWTRLVTQMVGTPEARAALPKTDLYEGFVSRKVKDTTSYIADKLRTWADAIPTKRGKFALEVDATRTATERLRIDPEHEEMMFNHVHKAMMAEVDKISDDLASLNPSDPKAFSEALRRGDLFGQFSGAIDEYQHSFEEAAAVAGLVMDNPKRMAHKAMIQAVSKDLRDSMAPVVQELQGLQASDTAFSMLADATVRLRKEAEIGAAHISADLVQRVLPAYEGAVKATDWTDRVVGETVAATAKVSANRLRGGLQQALNEVRAQRATQGLAVDRYAESSAILEKIASGELPPETLSVMGSMARPDVHLTAISTLAKVAPAQAMGHLTLAYTDLKAHLPRFMADNPEFASIVKRYAEDAQAIPSLALFMPDKFANEVSSAANFKLWMATQDEDAARAAGALTARLHRKRKLPLTTARAVARHVIERETMSIAATQVDDILERVWKTDELSTDLTKSLKKAEAIPDATVRRARIAELTKMQQDLGERTRLIEELGTQRGMDRAAYILSASPKERELGLALNKAYESYYEDLTARGVRLGERPSALISYRPDILTPEAATMIAGKYRLDMHEKQRRAVEAFDEVQAHIGRGEYDLARKKDAFGLLGGVQDYEMGRFLGPAGKDAWARGVAARAADLNVDIVDALTRPWEEQLWDGTVAKAARVHMSFSETALAGSDLAFTSYERKLPKYRTLAEHNEVAAMGGYSSFLPEAFWKSADGTPTGFKLLVDSPIDALHIYNATAAKQVSGRKVLDIALDMAQDANIPFMRLRSSDEYDAGKSLLEMGQDGWKRYPGDSMHGKRVLEVNTRHPVGQMMMDVASTKAPDIEWYKRAKKVEAVLAQHVADGGPQHLSLASLKAIQDHLNGKQGFLEGVGQTVLGAHKSLLSEGRKFLYLNVFGLPSLFVNELDNSLTMAVHSVSRNSALRGLAYAVRDFTQGENWFTKLFGKQEWAILEDLVKDFRIEKATLNTLDDASFLKGFKGEVWEKGTGRLVGAGALDRGRKGMDVLVDLGPDDVDRLRRASGLEIAPFRELDYRAMRKEAASFSAEEYAQRFLEERRPSGGKAVSKVAEIVTGVAPVSSLSDISEKRGRIATWLHYIEQGKTPREARNLVNDAFINYASPKKLTRADLSLPALLGFGEEMARRGEDYADVMIPGTGVKLDMPAITHFMKHVGPFATFNLYNIPRQIRMLYSNPRPISWMMRRWDQVNQLGMGTPGGLARDMAILAHHTGQYMSPYDITIGMGADISRDPGGSFIEKPALRVWSPEAYGFMEPLSIAHSVAGSLRDLVTQSASPITTNRKDLSAILGDKLTGALGPHLKFGAEMVTGRDFRSGQRLQEQGSPTNTFFGGDAPQSVTYLPGVGMVPRVVFKAVTEMTPYSRIIKSIFREVPERAGKYPGLAELLSHRLVSGVYTVDAERSMHTIDRQVREMAKGFEREARKRVEHSIRWGYGRQEDIEKQALDIAAREMAALDRIMNVTDPHSGRTIRWTDVLPKVYQGIDYLKKEKKE